jgi:hypothetical protein
MPIIQASEAKKVVVKKKKPDFIASIYASSQKRQSPSRPAGLP